MTHPRPHGSQLVTDRGQVGLPAGQTFSSEPSPTREMKQSRKAGKGKQFSSETGSAGVCAAHVGPVAESVRCRRVRGDGTTSCGSRAQLQ